MDENSDIDFFQSPCNGRDSCRTYLLTYSQACLEKVPDSNAFSKIVLDAFSKGKSTSKVQQWATCQEHHADGGVHYHMIIKLTKTRRWKPIFEDIRASHSICVNFSTENCGYLAGYRYVCKEKNVDTVLHSAGHPILSGVESPSAKKGFQRASQNAKKRKSLNMTERETATTPRQQSSKASATTSKRVRLSNADVAKFIVDNNLFTDQDLLSAAKERQAEGLPDIYNFILNKNTKALSDLVTMTWKLQNAPEVNERRSMDRMQLVLSYLDKPCVDGCNGDWIEAAVEVLMNNDINVFTFAGAVRKLLGEGRKKFNNLLLTGPTNSGKSFLLNPLEDIFKCFTNPAPGKYAWVGLDECEVCLLQDLRWSEELIKWSDFLLLLEGQTVHLARPKNLFSTDLTIHKSNTLPFFASTKEPLEFFNRFNVRDNKETAMMNSRWRMFNFKHSMPEEEIKDIKGCVHCFCVLVTRGM